MGLARTGRGSVVRVELRSPCSLFHKMPKFIIHYRVTVPSLTLVQAAARRDGFSGSQETAVQGRFRLSAEITHTRSPWPARSGNRTSPTFKGQGEVGRTGRWKRSL